MPLLDCGLTIESIVGRCDQTGLISLRRTVTHREVVKVARVSRLDGRSNEWAMYLGDCEKV